MNNLYTWTELNRRLRELKSDGAALALFHQLKAAGASSRWTKRTHARYRALRLKREKRELERVP